MNLARTCALLMVVFTAAVANAQTNSAPQATTTATPTHQEKIRRLLALTGAGDLGVQMIDQMFGSFKEALPTVPDEFWGAFRAKIKPADMVAMIVPVYEKHLSEADVDALTVFFSSPAGRRFVQKQPLILADTMKIGGEWGERLASEVAAELKAKGYMSGQ